MWEDHRRSESTTTVCRHRPVHHLTSSVQPIAAYAATQINAKINEVQKQIGPKKKA